jgi:hypothetical protein
MGIAIGKTALAPFARDWVGGDIDGLAQLADTLNGYGPQVTGVAAALSAQVQQVVGAAGWQGNAASAFTAAWERDSLTAQAVRQTADQVAGVVGWLAAALSQFEAWLEQAAAEASTHGVSIGPDGEPRQVRYPGTLGPGQAAAQQWLSDYQRSYQWCMQAARAARKQAAGALAGMARQIVDSAGNRLPDIAGDGITTSDLLADLLLGESAPQMGDVIEAIQKAWYGSGSHTPLGTDDPAAEPDDGDLGSFGVIDVLAGTLGTIINTYDDVHYYHKPLLESLYVESFGSEAALVLPALPKLMSALKTAEAIDGAVQGEETTGGETTGGEVATEGEAVADGLDPLALAGLALNDDIHNAFIEPWSADVHEHGVVMGLIDGYENATEVNTFKELEGNVTGAVELNSKLSVADVAIEDPKAIGKAIKQISEDIP